MAARSRPRAGQLKEELDEERSIWSQIRDDAKRIDGLMEAFRDLELDASTHLDVPRGRRLVQPKSYNESSSSEGSPGRYLHSKDHSGNRVFAPGPVRTEPTGQAKLTIEQEFQYLEERAKESAYSVLRSRQNEKVDEEEGTIWSKIKENARKIDGLVAQSNATSKKVVDLTAQQEALIKRGQSASDGIDKELETSLRENIKLGEEIEKLTEEMCERMQILEGLRGASEPAPSSASRAASVGKTQRDRQMKRKATDTLDDRESVVESPSAQPSPKVVAGGPKDRLKAMSAGSRAGSVPAGREGSVKAEDGDDNFKGERNRLSAGTEVLYRNNKSRSLEGEGILCRVTSVIGEGKQRRYEIIDADPDPPTPAQPYRASVNHLVAIPPPSANTTLPDQGIGKQVLALYPGTTTFYKAEVVAPWTGKKKIKQEEPEDVLNLVRLRFEGEDEADREMSVERRYVLPDR